MVGNHGDDDEIGPREMDMGAICGGGWAGACFISAGVCCAGIAGEAAWFCVSCLSLRADR